MKVGNHIGIILFMKYYEVVQKSFKECDNMYHIHRKSSHYYILKIIFPKKYYFIHDIPLRIF